MSTSSRASREPAASRRPRRAGSRGRELPPRPCGPRGGRGASRLRAGARRERAASSGAARSSIRRSPRCTCPSRRPSSVGRNAGPRVSSTRAPDVVEQRSREQQVGAQPRMELGESRGRSSRRRPCARAGRRRSCDGPRPSPGASGAALGGRRPPTKRPTAAFRPGCEISPARNSRKPSSSSASRRIAGASVGRIEVLPRARASEPRAAGGRGSDRRVRARAPRRPRRSGCPGGRRRSRRAPRSARSGRRARARGRGRRRASSAAPSSRPRTRPRRLGPARAPRSLTRDRV